MASSWGPCLPAKVAFVFVFLALSLSCFLCLPSYCQVFFLSLFGSRLIMAKRDSIRAGFTIPPYPMSMPRRHSRPSGSHSSTAAPSSYDAHPPSGSAYADLASETNPNPDDSSIHLSQPGYSTAIPTVPLPATTASDSHRSKSRRVFSPPEGDERTASPIARTLFHRSHYSQS